MHWSYKKRQDQKENLILEKPSTKLKSCIVNMRDLSKRCHFGLKLDELQSMSTSKSICCWPASRPCMEETMDCHLRCAASWKHSGTEIRSVREDRVKESSEFLLPKLDKWLRSSGLEQGRSVSRNILQTGSGHTRNQGDALTNIGTSSALNIRGLITGVP